MNPGQIKVIEKIRKLLALSKSPNEAEAALAATKAQQLLREYNLTEATIGDAPEPQLVEEEDHCTMSRIARWRIALANACCKVTSSSFVLSKGQDFQAITFIGRPHNIKAAEVLFDYLSQAVQRLARQLTDRRFNRDKYRDGVVHGLSLRLAQSRFEVGQSKALMILDDEIKKYKSGMNLTPAKGWKKPDTGAASFGRGVRDAGQVGLNKQIADRARTAQLGRVES